MAGVTPHVYSLVAAGLDLFEVIIDAAEHPEHFTRTVLIRTTSTRSNATLQVFITTSGQLLGTLTNNGGGQYRGEITVSTNPQNITVRSSFGGWLHAQSQLAKNDGSGSNRAGTAANYCAGGAPPAAVFEVETVSLPKLADQTLTPSKTTANGPLPVLYVAVIAPPVSN